MTKLLEFLKRTRAQRCVSFRDYHVGTFCGERLFSFYSWRTNQLFKRSGTSFSIGPILFWKEKL